MTSTQNAAIRAAEENRNNKAIEAETRRHNAEMERLGLLQHNETVRSNKANESIKRTSNVISRYGIDTNASTSRYATNTNASINEAKIKSQEKIALWEREIAQEKNAISRFLADIQSAKTASDMAKTRVEMEKLRQDIQNSMRQLALNEREQNNRDRAAKIEAKARTIDTLFTNWERATRIVGNNIDNGKSVTVDTAKEALGILNALF